MSYDNLCELEKANCTSGQTAIKLQMYGFCGKPNSVVDCKLNESSDILNSWFNSTVILSTVKFEYNGHCEGNILWFEVNKFNTNFVETPCILAINSMDSTN